MWEVGLVLAVNVVCGAELTEFVKGVMHGVKITADVKEDKKNKSTRHLGHHHQVCLFSYGCDHGDWRNN